MIRRFPIAQSPLEMLMLRSTWYALLASSLATALVAQKPTLTAADYAKWETLGSGALSPDGKWVAYDFRRGNNTTELRYRAVGSESERTVRSASNAQ